MTATEIAPTIAEPTDEQLVDLYRRVVRIRLFEEEAGRLTESGRVPGALHLYVGQEAVAAGVCAQLTDDDWVTSTHRGHGHLIAKGGQFFPMFAELFGKDTGACRGRGGSMHIADLSVGILGANGIVAGGIPVAVGAAFASRYRAESRVSVSFFGDGASNEGAFHEALNLAALWQLPAVFVCENNLYGEFTVQHRHQRITDIATRAEGYGMPGVVVDGMDAVAVWRAAGEAVDRARSGGGPTLLECKTYRFYDHVGVKGMRIPYRSEDEVTTWKQRDPVALLRTACLDQGACEPTTLDEIDERTREEIADAVRFADESPSPDPADLTADVYAEVDG